MTSFSPCQYGSLTKIPRQFLPLVSLQPQNIKANLSILSSMQINSVSVLFHLFCCITLSNLKWSQVLLTNWRHCIFCLLHKFRINLMFILRRMSNICNDEVLQSHSAFWIRSWQFLQTDFASTARHCWLITDASLCRVLNE